MFTTILPSSYIAPLLWALCDIVGALALVRTWRTRQGTAASTRDSLIAAWYVGYLSCSWVLTCSEKLHHKSIPPLSKSCTIHISVGQHGRSADCYVCLPRYGVIRFHDEVTDSSTTYLGNDSLTLLLLAVLAQISLFYTVLLVPIAVLLILGPSSRLEAPYQPNIPRFKIVTTLSQFLGYFALLTAVSGLASGNWSWLSQTWGARYVILRLTYTFLRFLSFMLPDLTPNPGLWWYFFTEMFDHFRPFFLMVFSVSSISRMFELFSIVAGPCVHLRPPILHQVSVCSLYPRGNCMSDNMPIDTTHFMQRFVYLASSAFSSHTQHLPILVCSSA